MVREEMSFKIRWLPLYRNGTINAILNRHFALVPSTKFWFNPIHSSGGDEEFWADGTFVCAILNRHVAPMPRIMHQDNLAIGTAMANSAKIHEIRPRMYIEDLL